MLIITYFHRIKESMTQFFFTQVFNHLFKNYKLTINEYSQTPFKKLENKYLIFYNLYFFHNHSDMCHSTPLKYISYLFLISNSIMTCFNKLLSLLLVLTMMSNVSCTLGVSTQLGTYYSTAVFQCVIKSGYMDATVLAFSSSSGVKPYAVQDIMNIKNSGINISIWLNPCRSREPKVQIQDFLKKVPKQLFDRIWIAPDNNPEQNCSWYNEKHPIDPATNCKYLLDILNQVKSQGIKTGVLTNKFVWGLIFKDTCLEADSQPLYWLPQAPNGVPSFDDFNPFAGWRQPSVKAYRTSAIVCGAYLNLHYYP